MDWKLEVVVVPVSDVDRSKKFYTERVGFNVDVDRSMGDGFRIVQLTPQGSGCSISIGVGLSGGEPGSLKGLQLVVADVDAARAQLVGNGVAVTEVRHIDEGEWLPGHGGDWNSFIFFDDPDGNSWTVQQAPANR